MYPLTMNITNTFLINFINFVIFELIIDQKNELLFKYLKMTLILSYSRSEYTNYKYRYSIHTCVCIDSTE